MDPEFVDTVGRLKRRGFSNEGAARNLKAPLSAVRKAVKQLRAAGVDMGPVKRRRPFTADEDAKLRGWIIDGVGLAEICRLMPERHPGSINNRLMWLRGRIEDERRRPAFARPRADFKPNPEHFPPDVPWRCKTPGCKGTKQPTGYCAACLSERVTA